MRYLLLIIVSLVALDSQVLARESGDVLKVASEDGSPSEEWWWSGLKGCKPSPEISMTDFTKQLDSKNEKYSFVPKLSKNGIYIITVPDQVAVSIWAHSLDKCEQGEEFEKVNVAIAMASQKIKDGEAPKALNGRAQIYEYFRQTYNKIYSKSLSHSEFEKLTKKYDQLLK